MEQVTAYKSLDGELHSSESEAISADLEFNVKELFETNEINTDWQASANFYNFNSWLNRLDEDQLHLFSEYVNYINYKNSRGDL